MSLASIIAGFYLCIIHFLVAISVTDGRYVDASGVSSTYNHSRKQEMRNSGESRNLFRINDDIFVTKENTSKSDVNDPKFAKKEEVDPLLQEYLAGSTGYYIVNGARMFYVFIKSIEENDDDPVVLWLNGGPGYSSNVGLFYENGPVLFRDDHSLKRNIRGWDRMANMIYVDQPTGTGFSYANNYYEIRTNLDDVAYDLYMFLQEFFYDPRHLHTYSNNRLFIAGEGYAGHYAPALALKILGAKQLRMGLPINLIGVAMGNALTHLGIQYETIPELAQQMNLISEKDMNDINAYVPACKASVEGCNLGHEMLCQSAYTNCLEIFSRTYTASKKNLYNFEEHAGGPTKYDWSKMKVLLNQVEVKRLLGVPVDKEFEPSNGIVSDALHADWAKSSQGTISTILQNGVKVLTYAGELDLAFNHVGMMRCARELQWLGQASFKGISNDISQGIPFLVDGQTKGLRFTHELLTFIKMFRAGHMVLIDQPRAGFVMMNRWMRKRGQEGEF